MQVLGKIHPSYFLLKNEGEGGVQRIKKLKYVIIPKNKSFRKEQMIKNEMDYYIGVGLCLYGAITISLASVLSTKLSR